MNSSDPQPTNSGHRADAWVCAGVFVLCLANYAATLAPSVSWGDSGEFITACYRLGICHPTGYPLYVLLGKIITFLPMGEAAFRVNLLSALCGAGAAALVSATVMHFARAFHHRASLLERAAAGIAAGLGLAFTQVLWSQSVIAEVYALHALMFAAWTFFLARWATERRFGDLMAGVLLFSVGLANHVTLILAVPALAGLFIAGFLDARYTLRDYVWLALPVVVGLSIYLFLPLRSMQDPPMDWGDPETYDNLMWVLRGGQFAILDSPGMDTTYVFTTVRNPIDFVLRHLRDFGFLLILCVPGLIVFWQDRRRVWMLGGWLITLAINCWWVTRYRRADNDNYLLPAYVITAILLGMGALYIIRLLAERMDQKSPIHAILCIVLAAFPLANYGHALRRCNEAGNYAARDYARTVLEAVPPGSALLFHGEEAQVLWHAKYVEGLAPNVALVGLNFLTTMDWYQRDLDREGVPVRAKMRIFQSEQEMYQYHANNVVAPILKTRPVYLTRYLPLPGITLTKVKRFPIPIDSAPPYFQMYLPFDGYATDNKPDLSGGVWKLEGGGAGE